MQQVIIETDKLYSLIKKAVREVLQEETSRLWLTNLPVVSDEENKDIERLYGKPEEKRDIAFSEIVDI
jgi:hypothetical protein